MFDTAVLLVIATSDTFTVQPLQYVSPDWAVDCPADDCEKEPIIMLMAPPYTCAKTSRHSASHTHRQYDAAGADPKALTLEPDEP